MNDIEETIKRYVALLVLLVLMMAIIGSLVYLSGTVGTRREADRILTTVPGTIESSESDDQIDRFFQIDPAIAQVLNRAQTDSGTTPLDTIDLNLRSVGAYLPVTGDTRFSLEIDAALPTPLPYPTSPPLPLEPLPEPEIQAQTQIGPPVPDESFTDEGTPRLIPYDIPEGVTCAPAGWPAAGLLTQRFHMYHPGIDIGVSLGTPVIATHSGQVIYTGWNEIGYGYLVILQSGPFITYYAHNTSFNVTEGQYVGKGSIIAWSGSTGNSSGPHIHYETRINDIPVDPLTFEARGYSSC